MLMFVVLSTGMLTGLTATVVSQVEPAFADKKECEDNGDNNCNDNTQKIEQENNCKIENENERGSNGNSNTNDLNCLNFAQNPDDGDALVDLLPESFLDLLP